MRQPSTEVTKRFRKRRKDRLNLLKAVPCQDCDGLFPPECMDFDHRPGEVKVRPVSWIIGQTWVKVLAEIAKCDLICANCHRIRTKRRRQEEEAA